MTRINLVPVVELYDQHLLAEIRELPRVVTYTEDIYSKRRVVQIPSRYTLGTGHVKFFVNKLEFLSDRQQHLVEEALARGFNVSFDMDAFCSRVKSLPSTYLNDFIPSNSEIELNRERLRERFNQRPNWYRLRGKIVSG